MSTSNWTITGLSWQRKSFTTSTSGSRNRSQKEFLQGRKREKLETQTQAVIEKWHPNKSLVKRCVNLFNNIIDYFRKVQTFRHYQTSLERWFSKGTTTSDPKPSTSHTLGKGIRRQRTQPCTSHTLGKGIRRQRTQPPESPETQLHDVIMEGDWPSKQ